MDGMTEARIAGIEARREMGEAQTDLVRDTDLAADHVENIKPKRTGGIDKDLLQRTVSGIEALEAERALLADDVKELLGKAKAGGLEPKVIRELLRERKKKDAAEQLDLLSYYRDALDA